MKLLSFSGVVLAILIMSTRSCDDPIFDGKSCTSGCYILKGKIIDSASKEGISGVDLKLYYNNGNYSIFRNSALLLNTRTNQTGEYYISFDATNYKDKEGYFSLDAKHSSYFINNEDMDGINYIKPKNIKLDQPYLGNFSMFWPGYIKLNVKASHSTTIKSLSFSTSYGRSGIGYWVSVRPGLDTTISLKTASDIQTNIKWFTYPQSSFGEKHDSVTVAKDGTLDYNIGL